jgi:hypothetical protein
MDVRPAGEVTITGPTPAGLEPSACPRYLWLDGERLAGAKLDLEASGFVGVQLCARCGVWTCDTSATYKQQSTGVWPYQFIEGSWSGSDLFTPEYWPTAFFCTDRVLESARRHRLTNFRFVPVGEGDYGAPVKYLRRGRR